MNQYKSPCAVVLGGHVNGYSIIQELSLGGIADIHLVIYDKASGLQPLAAKSKRVKQVHRMQKSADSLRAVLEAIHRQHDFLVVYPTDDFQMDLMCELYEALSGFCFFPVDPIKSIVYQDKFEQYRACERLGVPYPKTILMQTPADIEKLEGFLWPVIIKPVTRKDISVKQLFRLKTYASMEELRAAEGEYAEYFRQGHRFIASEVIPGDGSTLFSHVAYLGRDGKIINDWSGRKYSQRPDDFGVFATACNIAPAIVTELGRKLVEGIGLVGFMQTELKYDSRDGLYKLMEINLRPHMWNRVGGLSGVDLNLTHWRYALGEEAVKQTQDTKKDIRFAYLRHELQNRLEYGRAYRERQKKFLKGGDELVWAVYDRQDRRPFLQDTLSAIGAALRDLFKRILRR